jgi:hypothetical protein
MNIKDLIAEVRASKDNVVNQRRDFETWCYPIVEGIAGDAVLLADEVERLTTALDDAIDEAKAADLHRNLNRRVAGALGLLDERVDAETGEAYLPSWHDMPEQVTALRAEVERLTAANEELRLTLAAEQGRAEGAPSEQWRYVYAGEGYEWALPYVDADPRAVEYWARMDRTIRPPAHCDVSRTCGDKWLLRWHHDLNRAPSAYDTARAAMLAAKDGA